MKKIFTIITLLLAFFSVSAQQRVAERTYISTDKENYVAGEALWCSAYCLDITADNEDNVFSNMSSIVYLELHSAAGIAQTGKIALINGRGAGKIILAPNLPTGNYKLIAYTAQNKNEVGYGYDVPWAKTVSIFNTLTKDRVSDGVKVVEDDEYARLSAVEERAETTQKVYAVLPGNIRFSRSSSIPIRLENSTKDAVSLSVSIYHDDGILSTEAPVITDFVHDINAVGKGIIRFENNVLPEYEGEIIQGKISGPDAARISEFNDKYAFLSVPNEQSDVYSSTIADDGKMTFFTNNIYGDKEIVCEIDGIDSAYRCHIEIETPFVNANVGDIPTLMLCRDLGDKLTQRGIAMQIERRFAADTLYEYLPVRENPLLQESDRIRYILDDYTRFPLMEEVLIEFVEQVRARKKEDGKRDIQVRMEDAFREFYFARKTSLMMLDGIPIFDHEKIYRYDPLLVETLDIYPYRYFVGKRQFDGIVNFTTYKHNLPSMTFGENVRIINFQGAAFPLAYTCESILGSTEYPDYRETVYWHPIVNIQGGQSVELNCITPAYSGSFVVVIEGLTSKGEAIYERSSFKVD